MFGRRRDSLRDLVRSQHEEFLRYEERRDGEFRQRAEESRQREERLDRLVEETREYNREILLRNEKVYKSVLVRLEEMGKEIRSNTEETRAQTQALLRLIDRFDEPGGAAAA